MNCCSGRAIPVTGSGGASGLAAVRSQPNLSSPGSIAHSDEFPTVAVSVPMWLPTGSTRWPDALVRKCPAWSSHPDTLTNRHSLAFALALRGGLPEAEASMSAVLIAQLSALGEDHRHTLATRERLGWIQARRGRLQDATENWHQLVRDRERLLEPDHPDTVRARERLAKFPHDVSRWW